MRDTEFASGVIATLVVVVVPYLSYNCGFSNGQRKAATSVTAPPPEIISLPDRKDADYPGPPWAYVAGDNLRSTYRVRSGAFWIYRTYGFGITRGDGALGVPLETKIQVVDGE